MLHQPKHHTMFTRCKHHMNLHQCSQHAQPWQGQPGHLLTHRATSGDMQARHSTSSPKAARPCHNAKSQEWTLMRQEQASQRRQRVIFTTVNAQQTDSSDYNDGHESPRKRRRDAQPRAQQASRNCRKRPHENTLTTLSSHTLRQGCPEEPRELRLGLLIAHCKVLSPRAAGPTAGPYLASLSYRRDV